LAFEPTLRLEVGDTGGGTNWFLWIGGIIIVVLLIGGGYFFYMKRKDEGF